MKRKHLAGVIVCITVMVWLLSGVNGEINAVESDYECLFGISVATSGNTVTCTPYTHTTSGSPVSMSISLIVDRKPTQERGMMGDV